LLVTTGNYIQVRPWEQKIKKEMLDISSRYFYFFVLIQKVTKKIKATEKCLKFSRSSLHFVHITNLTEQ